MERLEGPSPARLLIVALVAAALTVPTVAVLASSPNDRGDGSGKNHFNQSGNLLITDQFNNRVI
jgi:hypothetical protein